MNRVGVVMLVGLVLVVCGCDALRFAPSEAVRQNSLLQQRTTAALAVRAKEEQTSAVLQALAQRAAVQSEAVLAYTGFPEQVNELDSVEELLGDQSVAITSHAQADGQQRPSVWQVTDALLELGIGLAALAGGVYGSRAVRAIRQLREKSKALKETVSGNELFKLQHPQPKDDFKQAHIAQSNQTRTLVAEMKS